MDNANLEVETGVSRKPETSSDKFELDMSDANKIYFKELTEKAILCKSQASSAKTDLKKKYFTKKLLKINKRIYAILGMSYKKKPV